MNQCRDKSTKNPNQNFSNPSKVSQLGLSIYMNLENSRFGIKMKNIPRCNKFPNSVPSNPIYINQNKIHLLIDLVPNKIQCIIAIILISQAVDQ